MRAAARNQSWLTLLALGICSLNAGEQPNRVWAGEEVNLWGSPSPDGQWLSFVDPASGNLAVRSVENGSVRLLTHKDPHGKSGEFAYFSVFAPDGEQLAYAWFNSRQHYELRIVSLDSAGNGASGPRILYSNPEVRFVQPCAWSSDGSSLLALFFREDNISQIVLLDIENGSVRVLRSLHWIYPKRMALSPDNRFLVYDNLSSQNSDERDLFILSTDGASDMRFLAGSANDQSPVWSADGKTISYVSNQGGDWAIWSVPFEEGVTGSEPRRLTEAVSRVLLLGATRSGDLFYGQRKGVASLFVQPWDPERSAVAGQPHAMRSGSSESDHLLPVFSPDGEYLAYLAQIGTENSGREHQALVLYSQKSNTSTMVQTRVSFIRDVDFSQDGSLLLLSGSDRRGRSGLFLYDRKLQRTRLLEQSVQPVIDGMPGAMHPSRPTVIFARQDDRNGDTVLFESDLQPDPVPRRILALGAGLNLKALAIAPDGEHIALAWNDTGTSRKMTLAVSALAGDAVAEPILTLASGELMDITWTVDGNNLLVGTRGPQGSLLWLVSSSGDSMKQVSSPQDRHAGLSFYPDGKQFVYAAGHTESEVWVLDDVLSLE